MVRYRIASKKKQKKKLVYMVRYCFVPKKIIKALKKKKNA